MALKSNDKFLSDLLEYSRFGPMTQVFIVEALRHYASAVAETPRPSEQDSRSLIHPALWHDIATDLLEQLTENYETVQRKPH